MSRRQWLVTGMILGGALFAYLIGFGPVIFVIIVADNHGLSAPGWIEKPIELFFHPHLWAMYHQEWYFDYISWIGERAGIPPGGFHWQDFRDHNAKHFAP